MSGSTYFGGLAAEDIAERHYSGLGFETLERRWRCPAGEIDLIVATTNLVVFVEVKARKTHDSAAHAISPRQWQRIMQAAEVFVEKRGLSPTTDLRFDAALIDHLGVCRVIENAPVV